MPAKLWFMTLVFSTLLSACSDRRYDPAAGILVDLAGIWDHPEEIRLSTLADDIEYIPLETNPECLLGDPGNLRITILDELIGIHSGVLYIFDSKGKYIRTIGEKGKGPGEITDYAGCAVDQRQGKVYFLDSKRKRILVYNINGSFEKEIKTGPNAARLCMGSDGRMGLLYLPYRLDTSDSARFEWLDRDGTVLESILLYQGRQKDGGGEWLIANRLFWRRDTLILAEWPFDTVYFLSGDRVWKPRWILHTGRNRMPREIGLDLDRWQVERSSFTSVVFTSESSRYLFLEAQRRDQYGQIVFDRLTMTARWMPGVINLEGMLETVQNDMDGGLPFFGTMAGEVQDDYFVTLLSPLDLIEKVRSHHPDTGFIARPDLHEKLVRLVEGLKEGDNPVIMLVTLKGMAE